jgi:hypothetical protein
MRRAWGGLSTSSGEYDEISGTCHVIGLYDMEGGLCFAVSVFRLERKNQPLRTGSFAFLLLIHRITEPRSGTVAFEVAPSAERVAPVLRQGTGFVKTWSGAARRLGVALPGSLHAVSQDSISDGRTRYQAKFPSSAVHFPFQH